MLALIQLLAPVARSLSQFHRQRQAADPWTEWSTLQTHLSSFATAHRLQGNALRNRLLAGVLCGTASKILAEAVASVHPYPVAVFLSPCRILLPRSHFTTSNCRLLPAP